MRTLGQVALYAAVAGATWLAYVVQAALIYVMLLLIAIFTNQDLGGPVAGPFLVILGGVVGVVLVPMAILPAVFTSDQIARRRHWRWVVPTALIVAATMTGIVAGAWTLIVHASAANGMVLWGALGGLSVLPLGMAGLVVSAGSLAPAALRSTWRRLHRRPAT
ncbi:MAG: hypothetical protein QOE92_1681 [Chloroflexota bacterium]|jgi:hypothetical protein|nr:hypothetical protein [Chloroflexota bacterium]